VWIDLHAHSTASDGTCPPAEVMARAAAAGLSVVALTDHDTVAGHVEAAANLPAGLTLVPGAEISCTLRRHGQRTELHLLAYLFDPDEPDFAAERDAVRDDRVRRAQAIVRRLQELGAPVTWEQVRRIAGDGSVGRPHLARALVEAGVVPDVPAAFTEEWIGAGGRAHVDKHALDPLRLLQLVHAAGGVVVFAHPGAEVRGPIVGDDTVAELAAAGLFGLEVDHPDQDERVRRRLRALAADLGLRVTGASDDHGALTGHRLGCEGTEPAVYEALVAAASRPPVSAGLPTS
jgi:predicted metal-dependent phosphoesterase TrpH